MLPSSGNVNKLISISASDLASLEGMRDSGATLPELTNEFLDSRVSVHSELFLSRASTCFVLSCLALSCLVLLCLVLSCFVLSCLALSCLVLSCLVLSYLSCLFLSFLVLSCLVLSCLFMSCLVFLCLNLNSQSNS